MLFYFWVSTFPYVTEISSISKSWVLEAKAISRASTSSQPFSRNGQDQQQITSCRVERKGKRITYRISIDNDFSLSHDQRESGSALFHLSHQFHHLVDAPLTSRPLGVGVPFLRSPSF